MDYIRLEIRTRKIIEFSVEFECEIDYMIGDVLLHVSEFLHIIIPTEGEIDNH